mmetsp:Transcript_928/g.2570  ORF Transcript_928/g.2570 Transcript_928/m.2570 type:complete len:163 (-) Transcript_928:3989-4477(-)
MDAALTTRMGAAQRSREALLAVAIFAVAARAQDTEDPEREVQDAQGLDDVEQALLDEDFSSVETMTVWAVLLFLHLLVIGCFCCCERPMAEPARMAPVEMEQNIATDRTDRSLKEGTDESFNSPRDSVLSDGSRRQRKVASDAGTLSARSTDPGAVSARSYR